MNILYVTDGKGREMLITSLLSLHRIHPEANVFIYFNCEPFPLPELYSYTFVKLTADQSFWTDQYPDMKRADGRYAPKTTFFKIAALYSLPAEFDEVLYLDIDTVVIDDISDVFSKFQSGIAGCHSLGSLKARQPFNAGVIAFRRSLLPEGFDKLYHHEVLLSNGRYGDQEVFSRTKISAEYISPIYNSRKKLRSTKILHLAGAKPQQTHAVTVSCNDDYLATYWSSAEVLSQDQQGVGKGNIAADRLYMEFYREALTWLEKNIEGYMRSSDNCKPRHIGALCNCGVRH